MKKEWSMNQIFKRIYLILFKGFTYLETFTGKARVWALNRMHSMDQTSQKLYEGKENKKMKYDVTTNHMFTQHWIVEAKDKNQAAEKVMQSDMKFDKTSRKFVSNKLTMGLVTIPDAKIMAVEEYEPDMTPNYDEIKIGGTDPE